MLSVTFLVSSALPTNGSVSTRSQMENPRTNSPSAVNARTRSMPRRSSASAAMHGTDWSLANNNVVTSTWPMSQIKLRQTVSTRASCPKSHPDKTFPLRRSMEVSTSGFSSLVRPFKQTTPDHSLIFVQELEQSRPITPNEPQKESLRANRKLHIQIDKMSAYVARTEKSFSPSKERVFCPHTSNQFRRHVNNLKVLPP